MDLFLTGFMDPMKICCGRHESSIDVWCGQRVIINGSEVSGVSCGSPASYISWDGVHYSQAANQWIANHILNGSFSDPPLAITHACLKHWACHLVQSYLLLSVLSNCKNMAGSVMARKKLLSELLPTSVYVEWHLIRCDKIWEFIVSSKLDDDAVIIIIICRDKCHWTT